MDRASGEREGEEGQDASSWSRVYKSLVFRDGWSAIDEPIKLGSLFAPLAVCPSLVGSGEDQRTNENAYPACNQTPCRRRRRRRSPRKIRPYKLLNLSPPRFDA